MAMAFLAGRGASARATGFALLNALVIAAYTLIDGIGVRRSGAPVAYTLWIILLPAIVLVGFALARHGRAFTTYARRNAGLGLVGGVATMTSYGLALWAMTHAPVAVVAALRENLHRVRDGDLGPGAARDGGTGPRRGHARDRGGGGGAAAG